MPRYSGYIYPITAFTGLSSANLSLQRQKTPQGVIFGVSLDQILLVMHVARLNVQQPNNFLIARTLSESTKWAW